MPTMQKPPHTSTIELTPEQMKRGQREHQFAQWMAEYRAETLTEDEWQVLLQWDKFSSWLMGLGG